jgi:16S rRNA processing protein RimM
VREPGPRGEPETQPGQSGKGLEVARIVAVHGLKGGLKVVPHWTGSTALFDATELTLHLASGESRQHRVESCTNAGRTLLLKLAGIDTREQAEPLRGARVEVRREDLAASESDAPFLVDLIGASVEGPDGPLGRVVEVIVNPSVDCVLVERPDGGRVEVVLRSEFLESIDAQRIVLSSRDAILE